MKTPCIIIPGFGQSKAELFDENGSSVRQVWPLKTDAKEMAKRILAPYLKTVLARRDRGFTDRVNELFSEVLEPLSTDENGEMRHPMRAVAYSDSLKDSPEKVRNYIYKLVPVASLAKEIGEENIFFFAYNAFEDPFLTAQRLDGFISDVKKETGSAKVDLLTFSMGGMISTAYLDRYGSKGEVGKVFYLAAAMRGSLLQADIFERHFDKKQGYSLLEFFASKKAGDTFRKVLAFVPWEVRYGVLYRSFDAIIETGMLNSPGMWALMPVERYRELSEKFISDERHTLLKEKTDRFFAAQTRLPETLEALQKQGMRFYAACGCGLRMIELSASDEVNSDTILAVGSPSLGAVAAKRGETLDEHGRDAAFLSPDRTIDASACMLRDTTWFFEGVSHRALSRSAKVGELIRRAFTDEGFTDVQSDKDFPRFME